MIDSVLGRVINGVKYSDIVDFWLFAYDGEVNLEAATTREVVGTVWMTKEQIKELFDQGNMVETLGFF